MPSRSSSKRGASPHIGLLQNETIWSGQLPLVPAEAGTQFWIPASAGMSGHHQAGSE